METKHKMKLLETQRGVRYLRWNHGSDRNRNYFPKNIQIYIHKDIKHQTHDGSYAFAANPLGYDPDKPGAALHYLSKNDKTLNFPLKNAAITKTKKGTLIITPQKKCSIHLVSQKTGTRGSNEIKILEGGEEIAYIKNLSYYCEHFQHETAIMFINTKTPVIIQADKTGLNKNKTYRITTDGEIEKLIPDDEICELCM